MSKMFANESEKRNFPAVNAGLKSEKVQRGEDVPCCKQM